MNRLKGLISAGLQRRISHRKLFGYLLSCCDPRLDLRGMTVVLDCANGAAYHVARSCGSAWGARGDKHVDKPNGINISGCGSTHTELLKEPYDNIMLIWG